MEKEEGEKFLPGTETEEQFEEVLSLLAGWIKAGIVDVGVDVDGDVVFDLPDEMEELLGTQISSDMTYKNVISIITQEIRVLASVGLAKKPEQSLKRRLPDKLLEKPEKLNVMVERSNRVIDVLITENVKQRVLLRKATSAYIVNSLQWNSGTYHIESGDKKKTDVPHILLEVNFARPHSANILTLREEGNVGVSRNDDITVILELHKDDLKDLIKKLNKIEEETL